MECGGVGGAGDPLDAQARHKTTAVAVEAVAVADGVDPSAHDGGLGGHGGADAVGVAGDGVHLRHCNSCCPVSQW